MSLNEEFLSTNEELESSKEELQSLNEELTTVNTQLRQALEQQQQASTDLSNLLNSSSVATIFLDAQLCINIFNPRMQELFSMIDSDIGSNSDAPTPASARHAERVAASVDHAVNADAVPKIKRPALSAFPRP